jgi:hypothetical protein
MWIKKSLMLVPQISADISIECRTWSVLRFIVVRRLASMILCNSARHSAHKDSTVTTESFVDATNASPIDYRNIDVGNNTKLNRYLLIT